MASGCPIGLDDPDGRNIHEAICLRHIREVGHCWRRLETLPLSYVGESTLPGHRALALQNLAFAIEAVARSFAFPDRDLVQLALVFAEDLQSHSR